MSPVRFLLALLSFLVSLLVIFPAPTVSLFQLKLGATEFGHWFALFALALVVAGKRRNFLDSTSVTLAIMAAALFASGSVRGLFYSPTALEEMNSVFPVAADHPETHGPFSYRAMWTFSQPTPVKTETLEFAFHKKKALSMDFYPAQDNPRGNAPCIVLIHGGGWDSGDRKEFTNFSNHLALRGIAVAAMDYRLAPASPWPAQLEDVSDALALLRVRASKLGISPDRFFVMGRSAGGQIAEAASVGGDLPGVLGCIALYAPADLNFAFKYANAKDILNSDLLLRQYLGGTPESVGKNYDLASAYSRVSPRTTPTLLLHGLEDELVWYKQSRRYAEQLKANGVKYVYLELPWATHAFDYNLHGPGGQIAAWAIERFVTSLKPKDTDAKATGAL